MHHADSDKDALPSPLMTIAALTCQFIGCWVDVYFLTGLGALFLGLMCAWFTRETGVCARADEHTRLEYLARPQLGASAVIGVACAR